jgi:hypothetical protein
MENNKEWASVVEEARFLDGRAKEWVQEQQAYTDYFIVKETSWIQLGEKYVQHCILIRFDTPIKLWWRTFILAGLRHHPFNCPSTFFSSLRHYL